MSNYILFFLFIVTCEALPTGNFADSLMVFLGKKRIPLPACAYTSIRKQFPLNADENYTGFELEDD